MGYRKRKVKSTITVNDALLLHEAGTITVTCKVAELSEKVKKYD